MIGDGGMRAKITSCVKEMGLSDRVMFVDPMTNIEAGYQAMDAFAFPSKHEGLGLVAIEAQLSGLPVIASAEVSREVGLTSACVFLGIRDGDASEWATRFCCVEAADGLRRELASLEARLAAKRSGYDIDSSAKMLRYVYESETETLHESERGL